MERRLLGVSLAVRGGRAVRASRLGVSRAVKVNWVVRSSRLWVIRAVRVIRAVKASRLAVRASWLAVRVSRPDSCVTSNLEGHNFFVRTPIQVFLDSMESPLSQYYSYILVDSIDSIGYWIRLERSNRARLIG